MTQPAPRSRRVLKIVLLLLALLALLCCGGFIAIPNFVDVPYKPARPEVPPNVDGIKTAEIAYEAAFDMFLAIPEPVPREIGSLDYEPQEWPRGTLFDELGWEPSGWVRGTYWVELNEDGSDFTVHGMCDLDGDGEPAHYTATRAIGATLISDPLEY